MADQPSGQDVVLFGPPTGDGESYNVIRCTDKDILTGVARPLKDGRPLHGEPLKLSPREGSPLPLYDVVHEGEAPRSGPAKVTTDSYRSGWDRVFGNRQVGQA